MVIFLFILPSVFLLIELNSKKVKDGFSVGVAPFHAHSSYDKNNLQNLIIKGLKKGLEGDSVNFSIFNKQILEADSDVVVKQCFNDCKTELIIWGSYSENLMGSIWFNLSFRNPCMSSWTDNQARTFKIDIKTPDIDDKIEKQFVQIAQSISIFRAVRVDPKTCVVNSIDEDIEKSMEERLKKFIAENKLNEWTKAYYIIWSSFYYNKRDFSKAYAILDESSKYYSKDLTILDLKALTLYQDKQYNKSLEQINYALQIYPDNLSLWNSRGIINRILGRNYESLTDYTHAVTNETDNNIKAIYLSNRGSLYNLMNQDDKAIDDYSTSIKLDPKKKKNYLLRAEAFMKRRQFSAAVNDFKLYLKDDEANKTTLIKYCLSLLGAREKDEALKKCQKVTLDNGKRLIDAFDIPGVDVRIE